MSRCKTLEDAVKLLSVMSFKGRNTKVKDGAELWDLGNLLESIQLNRDEPVKDQDYYVDHTGIYPMTKYGYIEKIPVYRVIFTG
jgi:hypothetical protein